MGRRRTLVSAAAALVALAWSHGAWADPPPQRLPSAVLVWPLIVVEGNGATTDTRVELVNLSNRAVQMHCTYVPSLSCSGYDFQVSLTPNQPISWLASRGTTIFTSFTAVPPFSSSGELKCIVQPDEDSIVAHNTIQGRASVFGVDGQTIGYGAVGFLRLIDGPLTNEIDLDGVTYTPCPAEQHFAFLASDPGNPQSESELVIAPCSEDLENLTAPPNIIQFQIFNEFEDAFSAGTTVVCSARRRLDQISNVFQRAVLGSDTGHLIVKGATSPILAMLIDHFQAAPGVPATAGNEPALRGSQAAVITTP